MKHRKLLSMLLALVMVLSLAPSAVFAEDVAQFIGDNVRVQNVRKVWQYRDGTEIPADELAALIDQGVIPASVDIFYALLSSNDRQIGYALAEKYHPGIETYYSAHPGSTGHAQPPYDSAYYDCRYWWGGLAGPIPEAELEALGWNADGWSSAIVSAYGEDAYDAYVNPEDIGGWSRQTLSQDNDWRTGFLEKLSSFCWEVDNWLSIGGVDAEEGFLNYAIRFDLHYNDVDYTFTPVREFLPDGYSLVSGTERTNGSVEYWADGDEGYAAAEQAWDEAGDVIRTGTSAYHLGGGLIAWEHQSSMKRYGDGWIYKVYNKDSGKEWTDYYVEYPVTFTNTYSGERPWKDITVTKTWDDEVETSRPESITVNLLANGEPVASQTVTADDDWGCTFEKMPVYSGGEKIDYTVSEEAVPGYETTVDGFEITNTCTSGTIQIVKKSEGAQTPDGTRFTISGTPVAEDVTFETRTVRYADFENGVYTLKNVPAGTYTVTEHTNDATLAGYELTVSGNGATKTLLRGDTVKFVITNEYERTTEEIPVHPTPTPTPAPALNTEDHYAYIIGYPDGLVRPNGTITRAEVVTVFFRMLTDASRDAIWSTTNSFTDVSLNEWFNNAISTIENGGIINGYPDGSFNPNGNITRAEFAAMAIRFFQDAKVGPSKFSDTIGHWAAEAISKAQNEGLIMGYPDGTFHPDQPITRAEAMTIFNRVLKRAPHKDHLLANMIQWPDNMNKAVWYYADVQEATNSHTYTMSDTTTSAHEIWQKLLPVRDWAAFEKAWSTAHSASNPGEVVNN